uniref:Uncharacterized protein n=1 Tax=Acrobeloides nanus TaxID=290746 RepID=A0A914E5T9_9BILA
MRGVCGSIFILSFLGLILIVNGRSEHKKGNETEFMKNPRCSLSSYRNGSECPKADDLFYYECCGEPKHECCTRLQVTFVLIMLSIVVLALLTWLCCCCCCCRC